MAQLLLEEGSVLKRFRAKFIKGEEVKFLSHLDILRTFNRALRRSGIPVAYSQGYNPHPITSFALPLSVGVTSDGEFVDVDIIEDLSADEFVEIINKGLPEELRVVEAKEVDLKSNIMSIISGAKYTVRVCGKGLDDLREKVSSLFAQESIFIEKETKKGIKEADIKPDIRDLKVLNKNGEYVELYMYLSAGSQSNLKPDAVVKALEKYCGVEVDDTDVHRVELIY